MLVTKVPFEDVVKFAELSGDDQEIHLKDRTVQGGLILSLLFGKWSKEISSAAGSRYTVYKTGRVTSRFHCPLAADTDIKVIIKTIKNKHPFIINEWSIELLNGKVVASGEWTLWYAI